MSPPAQHVRIPAARDFYPGDCQAQLTAFLADSRPPDDLPQPLRGAALPHAGWMYSGRVAAHTLDCFHAAPPPDVAIIFGAVHTAVPEHAIYPEGIWETPLGNIKVDKECAAAVLVAAGDTLRADPEAHRHEHSIEVLTPMVKHFFPDASIVPVMVLPTPTATRIGAAAAEAVIRLGRQAVYLASSDLTHYGAQFGMTPAGTGPKAKDWMEQNDRRLIDKLCHDTGKAVLNEALANRNACGAGALAALKGAMAATGSFEGRLIRYATSFDAEPESVFYRAVGYAGVVF